MAQIFFAPTAPERYFHSGLSDGVMVAQGPLEAFVMVRIHVGQPLPLPFQIYKLPDGIFSRVQNVMGGMGAYLETQSPPWQPSDLVFIGENI